MNEYIEINFTRRGKKWPVRKQFEDGQIEFEESDPIPRRVAVYLEPRAESTRERMKWVRQRLGWHGSDFQLDMRAEGGTLVLRGVRQDAHDTSTNLPPGFYNLRVQVEEAVVRKQAAGVQLKSEGYHEATVDLATDDRTITVDLVGCDAEVERILSASSIDGATGLDWVRLPDRRPSQRACLLNLIASLRARPVLKDPLSSLVRSFFWASHDRAYAQTDVELIKRLEALARDESKPFYREGRPTAKIHEQLLDQIPSGDADKFSTARLVSFRGEKSPSLQVVTAAPSEGSLAYAEFDLDLGNALQDLWGIIVHVGELVDGKPTNHLDLHKKLSKTPAGPFLHYTVQPAPK